MAAVLYEHSKKEHLGWMPLVPYASNVQIKRDQKWRMVVNIDMESDLNDGANQLH